MFALDDVALCQLFSPEDITIKFYKRRVIEVTEDYVTLSKTDVNGTDIPEKNDTIIHFGNYTKEYRQYVITRDVIGGGYEEMLTGLNSVNSYGVVYYFAGMIGGVPQWFVGNRQGDYAEWDGDSMRIKGKLEVGSDVGGATVVDGGLVTAETISLGSEGLIKAGVTGTGDSEDDVRFWAGETSDNRQNAPFKVLQDGSFVSTRGNIGGFEIYSTNLVNAQKDGATTTTLGLSSKYIYFSEKKENQDGEDIQTKVGFFGTSIITAGYELEPFMRVEVNEDKTYIDYDGNMKLKSGSNTGLYVESKGNMVNQDMSAINGNHAILSPYGCYTGFRMRTRRIGVDENLSVLDNIILVTQLGIILTLPANAEDGQIYIIKSYANKPNGTTKMFTCKCQGEDEIWGWQDGGSNNTILEVRTNQTLIMHYDAANKTWLSSYLATLD